MKYNELTPEESYVLEQKGTERPFSGRYNDFYKDGIYLCKRCGAELYRSIDKFSSGCGWPSFDDEIESAIKKIPDEDGKRTEIVCSTCGGHLGHIFYGEGFTSKNTRHCVNSISMIFKDANLECEQHAFAYFAAGCFWGVEYYFKNLEGVYSAICGYMGGHEENPNYEIVCTGNSGHLEVVRVEYDECIVSFEELAKYFFEIHDFTQTNGQGPDIGSQYLSAIFYIDEKQKQDSLKLINYLEEMGYKVATSLYNASEISFYEAENYHQNYYTKSGKKPYCHKYSKIF